MSFSIGDSVWYANRISAPKRLECPDCFGTRHMRVILADGTEHTVDCRNCEWGFEGPHGYVNAYELSGYASSGVISGISVRDGVWKYTGDGFYEASEDEIFLAKEDAEVRARQMAEQLTSENDARLLLKEKDSKSWAWNANYHRQAIRRAQKDLEYHTAKLNVAKAKAVSK